MELLKRGDRGKDSLLPWAKGGLDFGYGPASYAFYFQREWTDPMLKARCDAAPAIAVFEKRPYFSSAIGAAMKHVAAIIVSRMDDPVLLLAAEHASYVHRPGSVIVAESAGDVLEADEELEKKVKDQLKLMEETAERLLKASGGVDGIFSKNRRYLKAKKIGMIAESRDPKQVLEEALLLRYWLRKDVDVFIPFSKRAELGREWRILNRPDIRIVCDDEALRKGKPLAGENIREAFEKNEIEVREVPHRDVLEGFSGKKRYF